MFKPKISKETGKLQSVSYKRRLAPYTFVYGTGKGIKAEAFFTDYVTPELLKIMAEFDAVLLNAMYTGGKAIGEAVFKNYEKQKLFYRNKPMTTIIKTTLGRNLAVLEETGKLKDSLKHYRVIVEHLAPCKYKLHVLWDFPTTSGTGVAPEYRKGRAQKYIWIHEFGSVNMKKLASLSHMVGRRPIFTIKNENWALEPRPFFLMGLKNGCEQFSVIMATALTPYLYLLRREKAFRKKKLPDILPDIRPTTTPIGYSLYWVPPNTALAYIGASSDILGYFSGTFTENALFAYVRQMAWGQFGITKKSMRRQFRHALW